VGDEAGEGGAAFSASCPGRHGGDCGDVEARRESGDFDGGGGWTPKNGGASMLSRREGGEERGHVWGEDPCFFFQFEGVFAPNPRKGVDLFYLLRPDSSPTTLNVPILARYSLGLATLAWKRRTNPKQEGTSDEGRVGTRFKENRQHIHLYTTRFYPSVSNHPYEQ